VALDFPVGTDFPANGDQIPDGHEYGGFYWDSAAGVWKRLCDRDKIGDCLDENADETVCDRLTFLQNEIIELEEEIDALAPSIQRGSWQFTLSGAVTGPGIFTAYDEYVATSGYPIGLVTSIKSLWFHSTDNAGTPHGFDNVEEGNLLELFVEGSPEYGLFVVKAAHDYTAGAGDYWVIDVDCIRTLEQTTRFDNGEVCRLKIFEAPSGGDASDFVLKSGDTMPGPNPLTIKTTKTSNNYNSPGTNTAYIKFENDNSGSTRTLSLFKAGPDSTLVTDGGFMARGSVWSSGDFYAYTGTTTVNPRMVLGSSEGKLAYGNSAKLTWQSDGIKELIAKGIDGDKGMVLKRDRGSSNRIEWSGVVDINTSSSNRCVGELWYNNNDGVLYLRIS